MSLLPQLRRRHAVLATLALCLSVGVQAQAVVPAPSPPWFQQGAPGPLAEQALDLLAHAQEHGLDPRDYGTTRLRQLLNGAGNDPARQAQAEAALTSATVAYLRDLRLGRIDPRSLHHDFSVQAQAYDAVAALQAVQSPQELVAAAQAAAPALPQYDQMRQALVLYRTLASHNAWKQPLPPLPAPAGRRTTKLEPGQAWTGLDLLAERLVALGDLRSDGSAGRTAATSAAASASAATSVPPTAAPVVPQPTYEPVVVEAVRTFQTRHGLPADGVIGRATLAALQVSPADRVRQIELGLERMRWTPLMQDSRMIVINIPEFVLRAYEVQDGRISVEAEMKVIVGKALDTRTPLFDEVMRFIEFSPYWNVPPSIARGETIPKLRRDPGYLARQGFEFVGPGGQVSTGVTPGHLDAVLAGQLRIRQRPGPHNALGDIKFVFPNADNIYLHHTPSVSLFERERRDFSHGCIRVEQPVALARFVLQDQPEWTEERIRATMSAGTSNTLKLARPVPVLIAYGTSLVKGGRIYFYDDLYGHDRRLSAALDNRTERLGGSRP
jgi:L,D-transpeptidase YcbB